MQSQQVKQFYDCRLSYSLLELEVVLLVVLLHSLLSRLHRRSIELSWPHGACCCEVARSISITLSIVFHLLLLCEFPNKNGVVRATPHLSRWNKGAGPDHGIGQDLAASLKPGALLDDRAGANDAIVIDDARVNIAVRLNRHVLADVHGGGETVGQRVIRIDRAPIANRGEVADTDWVHLAPDCHAVPDGGVLGDEDTSYEG